MLYIEELKVKFVLSVIDEQNQKQSFLMNTRFLSIPNPVLETTRKKRAEDRNHDREKTDRYKQVESMTELTSYREIDNYTDREMLGKQTGRAEIKAIHGRNNTVFLDRFHNAVTEDRMWTGRQTAKSLNDFSLQRGIHQPQQFKLNYNYKFLHQSTNSQLQQPESEWKLKM